MARDTHVNRELDERAPGHVGQREVKGCAATGGGFRINRPPVTVDNMLNDDEPDPSAFERCILMQSAKLSKKMSG